MLGQLTAEERNQRSRIFVLGERKDGKLRVRYVWTGFAPVVKINTPEKLEAEKAQYDVLGGRA